MRRGPSKGGPLCFLIREKVMPLNSEQKNQINNKYKNIINCQIILIMKSFKKITKLKNFLTKALFLIVLLIASFVFTGYAQVPQSIPYQAVARNTSGNLIANQNVSLRFSIHDATAGGTIIYQETQNATTNSLGLFTVNIGAGTSVIGTFSSINWGTNFKYTQVEIDPTGWNSTGYLDMGTNQMMSVPYALYAAHSNDAGPQGTIGAQGPQGTAGTNGTNGTNGAQGPQGTIGAQGPQGTIGAQGPQGTIGAQGPQGTAGTNGTDRKSVV